MRLLPLLLLLSACAAPSGAYMDGAPLAPPEPRVTYTPTGTGLPEYWGTPEAPKAERSPHKRELPPTREPGLWAGDQPRVKASSGGPNPRICGVEVPMAPIDPREDLLTQIAPTAKCLQSVVRRIDILGLQERIEAMQMPERTCVIARMYALCNQREMEKAGHELAASGAGAAALSPHLVRAANHAEAFRARACETIDSAEADAILNLVERRWDVIETHGGAKK